MPFSQIHGSQMPRLRLEQSLGGTAAGKNSEGIIPEPPDADLQPAVHITHGITGAVPNPDQLRDLWARTEIHTCHRSDPSASKLALHSPSCLDFSLSAPEYIFLLQT